MVWRLRITLILLTIFALLLTGCGLSKADAESLILAEILDKRLDKIKVDFPFLYDTKEGYCYVYWCSLHNLEHKKSMAALEKFGAGTLGDLVDDGLIRIGAAEDKTLKGMYVVYVRFSDSAMKYVELPKDKDVGTAVITVADIPVVKVQKVEMSGEGKTAKAYVLVNYVFTEFGHRYYPLGKVWGSGTVTFNKDTDNEWKVDDFDVTLFKLKG